MIVGWIGFYAGLIFSGVVHINADLDRQIEREYRMEKGSIVNGIEVTRSDADGQWYFHGRANNNEIIFSSEGYVRKIDAVKLAGDLADELHTSVEVHGD